MGFSIPLAAWFRGPLLELTNDNVLGKDMRSLGIFDEKYIRRLIREHVSGIGDHGSVLWSLLMFSLFHRDVMN